MIPNILTLSAFGPYSSSITINFDHFQQSGLFLITGPTGSGKTMIFDAIMFALYGKTSGNVRETDSLRCDHSPNDIPTYVELQFTLHLKNYTIKRSPKYFLLGKKTPKQQTALLTLPDGKIVEGVKDVNSKIIDILGVNDQQFKQIAMIAQGEFTKLILASSDEREKILRNLFHTSRYKLLEENLKQKVKEYQNQYDRLLHRKNELVKELNLDHHHYDDDLKQLSNHIKTFEQDLKQKEEDYAKYLHQLEVHQINNQRILHLKQLKNQYQQCLQQEKDYQKIMQDIQLIKQAKETNVIYTNQLQQKQKMIELENEILKKKQDLSLLQQQFHDIDQEHQKIEQYQEDKEKLNKDLIDLDHLIEQVQTYLIDSKQKEKYDAKFIQENKTLEQLTKRKTEIERRLTKDKETIGEENKLKAEFALAQEKYASIHLRKTKLHELSEEYDKILYELDKKADLEETYLKIEKKLSQAKHQLDIYERQFRHNQAGILAQSLQENSPCPVCGSLHHPRPALLDQEVITNDILDRQEGLVKTLTEQYNDSYQQLILKKQYIETSFQHLDDMCLELGIEEELSKEVFIKKLSETYTQEKEIKKSYATMSNHLKYLEKLRKTVFLTQKDYDELVLQETKQINLIEQIKMQIHQIEGRLHTSLAQYDLVQLKQDKKQYQNDLNALQEKINYIMTSYNKMHERLIKQQEVTNNLFKQKEETYHLYQRTYQDYLNSLQYYQDEQQFFILKEKIEQLDDLEKQYHDYMILKGSIEKQIESLSQEVKDLSLVQINELQNLVNKLQIVIQDQQKELEEMKISYLMKKRIIDEINNINQILENEGVMYQRYVDLYHVASGKNQARVSLERYVLAAYFEHVLRYANVTMKRLSQGRYQLLRRDYASKGRSQQGLELDVLDMESGQIRDIKTLSGGESFKAALSLALGLSQMIQEYAGGIELNTLFIDEGFGSLDSQSLDQAINCLIDLRQDHKLIGMISHVSELQDRIDSQIVVTRHDKESKIRII